VADTIIFKVKGSSPEPYTIKINFEPFTISCTCQAGYSGFICKHRMSILYGANVNIVDGDISLLPKIEKMIKETVLFDMIEKHENAKKERVKVLKFINNAFKDYREAREDFILKKVKTDKAINKYREALENAIDNGAESEKEVEKTLELLQTVFIRPN
jgi:uncharacterized Zn finger protein